MKVGKNKLKGFIIVLLFFALGCSNIGMSDRTVHATAFVDHLNNMPSGKSSYLLCFIIVVLLHTM